MAIRPPLSEVHAARTLLSGVACHLSPTAAADPRPSPCFARCPVTSRPSWPGCRPTAQRVVRLCQRRGLFEAGSTDPLWEQEPLLAQISAASVQGMVATGERAGRRVRRRLTDPEDGVRSGALCYASRGFSLHAATRIEATDRRRLERLCRYVIQPPIASGRLRFVDEETLVFSLRTHWADGTCQLLLSPQELLEKLAALVPPPRLNLVRYHGVLAPACPDRAKIVPGPSELPQTEGCEHGAPSGRRVHRVSWARLLVRVFQYDVRVCPSCSGRMKVIAALTAPSAVDVCRLCAACH